MKKTALDVKGVERMTKCDPELMIVTIRMSVILTQTATKTFEIVYSCFSNVWSVWINSIDISTVWQK